jgi:thymidine phosphorylase
MLQIAGVAQSEAEARRSLERVLANGEAFERFARMVKAHGGDVRTVENPDLLPRSPARVAVTAETSGYVQDANPLELALVALALGAGRTQAEDKVDPAAGIELVSKPGARVARGEPLAYLHARSRSVAERQLERCRGAFLIGARTPKTRPLLIDRVTADASARRVQRGTQRRPRSR